MSDKTIAYPTAKTMSYKQDCVRTEDTMAASLKYYKDDGTFRWEQRHYSGPHQTKGKR